MKKTQRKVASYKCFYVESEKMEERGTVERREDGHWYWRQPEFRNPNMPNTIANIPEWKIWSMAR